MNPNTRVCAFLLAGLTLQGCGSDGSSGTASVSPLAVPSQISIVEAQEGDPGVAPSLRAASSVAAALAVGFAEPTTGDYVRDRTRLWVQDESMEALSIINEILCYVSQSGYDDPELLNTGPFRVLIDTDSCRRSDRQAPQANQQGGAANTSEAALNYQEWTVDSRRATESSEQIVSVWFEETEEHDGELRTQEFYVRLRILESPTESLPYGSFELNFKTLPSGAPITADPLFFGRLATVPRVDGQAEYVFTNENGDFEANPEPGGHSGRTRARVVTADGGVSGQAFISEESKFHNGVTVESRSSVFDINYDADYLARRRVDGASEVKLFDRNDFDTYGWRYGLYDSTTGNRVDRESGFSIRTEDGAYGWAGYHGIWLPENVQLSDGQRLLRDRRGTSGEAEAFTALVRGGRLRKRELIELELADIEDEDLFFWTGEGQVIVRWDGADLLIVAEENDGAMGDSRFTPLPTPRALSEVVTPGDLLHFWSDGRGSVQFEWPAEGSPSDSTPVRIRTEEFILPSSAEFDSFATLSLHGFFSAPRPLTTLAQLDYVEGHSPFFDDVQMVGNAITYTIMPPDMVLQQDGLAVLPMNGVDMSETQSMYGIQSGPLVPALPASVQDVWEAPVVYEWEYGPQDWNRLRVLLDSEGDVVEFDRPLRIEYTHVDAEDPEFNGKTFRLEYNGFGDLHGLPHREQPNGDWLPLISIPSGTEVQVGDSVYVVKLLEGEQRMVEIADGAMTIIADRGLGFDETLDPPPALFTDPDIGARPVVSTPPAYVAGVAQD